MKTPVTLLTAIAFSLAGLISAYTTQPAIRTSESQACLPYTVRIEHTYHLRQGSTILVVPMLGLGTAITSHIVLTHNHFNPKPRPGRGEMIVLTECSGKTTTLAVDRLKVIALDDGTTLIFLPEEVVLTVAPLAEAQAIARLSNGSWLSVSYWDDTAGHLAQHDFEVVKVENNVATLADPDHIINRGDSGGGTFFEGKLVGNTWARYTDQNGLPMGLFDIALLPVSVQSLEVETKPVEQDDPPFSR